MKTIIIISVLFATILFAGPVSVSAQIINMTDKHTSVFIHASAGATYKWEKVYELELGVKELNTNFFVSIPGLVYNSKTVNDRRSHVYYGIRGHYLLNISNVVGVSPFASYLRHFTGEYGYWNKSNDWDAGIRFYKFNEHEILASAAWTVTARYLHTRENVFNIKGDYTLPINKFIVSIGIYGLF